MSTLRISVIICTHNPRTDYLARVLEALRSQTLPLRQWELLVVDNDSEAPLSGLVDLTWHPNGRHVREDDLGLISARMRGVSEAHAALLIFVDDDNVLDESYLDAALQIENDYPFLGAWGGNIRAEFEIEPARWMLPHLGNLAIRTCRTPTWSNDMESGLSRPCGAGLCIRAKVARCHLRNLRDDPVRRQYGRRGTSLLSGEDIDLTYTAADFALGWGNFPSLSMIHLIPPWRLAPAYMLRLIEGIRTTETAMALKRGWRVAAPRSPFRLVLRFILVFLRNGLWAARVAAACERGLVAGHRLAANEFGEI